MVLTTRFVPVKTMTPSFLARIISDAQDAQQEMEMYRSERDRSLKLNHRFEEIVKEQDQKLAEQRNREEQQQGGARQILTRHYGYGPEQLNGHDPVHLLYQLQPRAAASYREQFQRGSGKSVDATVALGEEMTRLSGEVRRLSDQVQELQDYKRRAEPTLAHWQEERSRTMQYLRTTAGRNGQGEYYVQSDSLEGAVREFAAAYQRSRQPPSPPPPRRQHLSTAEPPERTENPSPVPEAAETRPLQENSPESSPERSPLSSSSSPSPRVYGGQKWLLGARRGLKGK